MDVDKIQKINSLALELMNQGLVSNRQEAVIQAEKMIIKSGSEDYASIRERMETKPVSSSRPEESLTQDQIKEILGQNTNFIVKSLREFQEKIAAMEKEVLTLQEQVKAAPSMMNMREMVSEIKSQRPENSPQAPQRGEGQQVGSSHPRSGNYKDADVSIEKYFYMGNKK